MRDGHHYEVRVNDTTGNPRILEMLRHKFLQRVRDAFLSLILDQIGASEADR